MDNSELGRIGEKIAKEFLNKRGYEILEKNYRRRYGEIDIIALYEGAIVFIEVKTRSTIQFGYPAEAVDSRKIKKIVKTAKCYISENSAYESDFRFDVIEIYIAEKKINHIKGAF